MDRDRLIARLRAHQAKIIANFDLTTEMLAEGRPADPKALVLLRGELIRALNAYQYFKHRDIFDVLIADGPTERARIGRRLKAECISLGEEVHHHVNSWNEMGIERSWSAYRPELLAFICRVRMHMEYEIHAAVAALAPETSFSFVPSPALPAA